MTAMSSAGLLQQAGLDPMTRAILMGTTFLDNCGAQSWNLRLVGITTTFTLWMIRVIFQKKRGVDWYALLHALISSLGSILCVYLDLFAAETLTGTPEPLRSCQCAPPLTSLHRILPAITMGYSLFDLLDGLTIGIDFALHGLATLLIMAFFCEHDVPHIITPMLLMEASTPFLAIVKADFFSETASLLNQMGFALTFFSCRIVIVPYMWLILMWTMMEQKSSPRYQECFPSYLFPVSFIFGMFFNVLNLYWFIKIVKKARRKLLGIEKVHHGNELNENKVKRV
jgi:hypothetical protein